MAERVFDFVFPPAVNFWGGSFFFSIRQCRLRFFLKVFPARRRPVGFQNNDRTDMIGQQTVCSDGNSAFAAPFKHAGNIEPPNILPPPTIYC